jgi:CheY-like chemotaxis protein
MPRTRVLLLEDNAAEATLAESALLFAGAEVVKSPQRAVVAVLGRKALRTQAGKLRIPAVAIIHDPTEEDRKRAREHGVRAVYERPSTWQGYTALVGKALADWLPTRKD